MRRVVLDGLPLQVKSAGIAAYTRALAAEIARQRPELEVALLGLGGWCLRLLPGRNRIATESSPPNVRWVRSAAYPLVMGGYPFGDLPSPIAVESVAGAADVFHATNYATPRARVTAVVVTVHDLALVRLPHVGTPALRRLVGRVRESAARARRVIAVSHSTKADLIELLGVPAEKIDVVHSGCDPAFRPMPTAEARHVAKEIYGIDGPYLLHVGTLEPRKNLAVLLRAYASLRRSGTIDRKLVLAGEGGWGYEPLFRLAEDLGLAGDALFLGRVPSGHLPALYNGADLFVYPTLYEGFGLPALEAMACGLPVVASNTSSLPEVLGEAGLLVDPTDESDLAAGIARALDDAELSRRMRSLGLERARLFSWERCGRETLAVYAAACARETP